MAAGYFGKVLRHDKFVNYLGFGLELRQGYKRQGYKMGVLLSTSFYILYKVVLAFQPFFCYYMSSSLQVVFTIQRPMTVK